MQDAGRHTPTPALRDATREEIQALLETPQLRRIFGQQADETGSEAPSGTAKGRSDARKGRRLAGAASRRPGVARRIAVGLVPVYLAIPIVLYEAGPEATDLLHAFRIEEAVAENTAEAAAPLSAPVLQRIAATGVVEKAPTIDAAGTPGRVASAKRGGPARVAAVADRSPGKMPEKSAIDVGKRALQEDAASLHAPRAAEEDIIAELADSVVPAMPHPGARPSSGAYPDLPEAVARNAGFVLPDLEQAAATEEALRLSRGDRREIQRRLRLADFDPQLVDGIFGPATRSAIEAWQSAAGVPATGYVDDATMALLVEQTAEEYRAWRAAERARARREEEQSAIVAASALPVPRTRQIDGCRRSAAGDIAFGQGMRCDMQGLGENFRSDFNQLKLELDQLLR